MSRMLMLAFLVISQVSVTRAQETWRLREVTRIDGMNAAHPFSRVVDLAVEGRERVYVLDALAPAVYVFRSNGQLAQILGRRGSGPGEFGRPVSLGLSADTLWVADNRLRRLTFFDQKGRVLVTLPLFRVSEQWASGAPVSVVALLADGRLLVRPALAAREAADARPVLLPLLRVSRDGETGDTLAVPYHGHPLLITRPPAGGLRASNFQPFNDGALFASASNGSVSVIVERQAATNAQRANYRVTAFGATGDTLFSRAYAYVPVRLEDSEVDSVVRLEAEQQQVGFPSLRAAESAVREALYVPPFVPPVGDVIVGRNGWIWLRRDDVAQADSVPWHVLDRTGSPIRVVVAHRRLSLLEAETERVWGIEYDPFEVADVIQLQLTR